MVAGKVRKMSLFIISTSLPMIRDTLIEEQPSKKESTLRTCKAFFYIPLYTPIYPYIPPYCTVLTSYFRLTYRLCRYMFTKPDGGNGIHQINLDAR